MQKPTESSNPDLRGRLRLPEHPVVKAIETVLRAETVKRLRKPQDKPASQG